MSSGVKEVVIQTIREEKPETLKQLVELLEPKLEMDNCEIMDVVLQLKRDGKIRFLDDYLASREVQSLPEFLRTKATYWFWITIIFILATILAVIGIQKQNPFGFVRVFLGLVFVIVVPGYSLVRVLISNRLVKFGKTTSTNQLTVFSLAVVLSIAVVSMVGLVLDYTPWGINLGTLVFSLSAFTGFFATIAIILENKNLNEPYLIYRDDNR